MAIPPAEKFFSSVILLFDCDFQIGHTLLRDDIKKHIALLAQNVSDIPLILNHRTEILCFFSVPMGGKIDSS